MVRNRERVVFCEMCELFEIRVLGFTFFGNYSLFYYESSHDFQAQFTFFVSFRLVCYPRFFFISVLVQSNDSCSFDMCVCCLFKVFVDFMVFYKSTSHKLKLDQQQLTSIKTRERKINICNLQVTIYNHRVASSKKEQMRKKSRYQIPIFR